MGEYVALPGVKTWYEVEGEGEGEPLLLLHGGLCTNDLWGPQRTEFAARYRVYLPERRAHGHTPDIEGPLTYEDMAQDTADFIESVVKGPAHLVGWSDGGIVALLVAIRRPDLVRKIVSVGANTLPTPAVAVAPQMLEGMVPESPRMERFRAMYAAVSPDGPDHWPVAAGKVIDMFMTQPNLTEEELGRIRAPTLVMVGDDDLMTLEHTIAIYRAVPGAELAVVPGTSHGLLMEKPGLTNRLVLDFLGHDPVPTMMPVLRARSASPG